MPQTMSRLDRVLALLRYKKWIIGNTLVVAVLAVARNITPAISAAIISLLLLFVLVIVLPSIDSGCLLSSAFLFYSVVRPEKGARAVPT